MSNFNSIHRTLSFSLAFASLLIASNLAVAQQANEEIVVRASAEHVMDVSPVGSSVKIEEIQINKHVDIADLDLADPKDVNELDMRIETVAKESCQKLSEMSPLDRSNPMEMSVCIKRAISSVEKQRETAISIGH